MKRLAFLIACLVLIGCERQVDQKEKPDEKPYIQEDIDQTQEQLDLNKLIIKSVIIMIQSFFLKKKREAVH